MTASRIGILGGTFDPVHFGHLDAAGAARHALALAGVVLVPSRVPPHKAPGRPVSGYHRFAMATLATADHEHLQVSDVELRSDSSMPSYTSTTLQQLSRAGYDPTQLFFILGSDAFAEIAHWHGYPGLLDRSHFVVVSRPGLPADQLRDRLPALSRRMRAAPGRGNGPGPSLAAAPAVWLVETDTRNVSSSDIRSRVGRGDPVDGLLPPMVISHIARHRLYAGASCGEPFA